MQTNSTALRERLEYNCDAPLSDCFEGAAMTTTPGTSPRQQALQAFLQDLPQLFLQRPRQWVAYQGDRLLGFAEQKHLLYQQCSERGLQQEEFVIFCIEPQET
jgi:hypothetical protein